MALNINLMEHYEKCFDPRKLKDTYLCQKSAFLTDAIFQLFPPLLKILSSGAVKGDSLIQITFGPFIQYTLPACKYFTEIFFACPNNKSIQEVKKWLKEDSDALDWSHAIKDICELQGSGETPMECQNMIRRKIKDVFKCDLNKSNPLSPVVLPPADSLLLVHCLEFLTNDKETFCKAMKNVSSLLKPGGHLLMVIDLKTTFFMFGDFKFPVLYIEESPLRSTLNDAGYVIRESHIFHRKTECLYDLTDYGDVMVLYACKEREVQPSDT
ncbi:nicotinamide N-methyltransferase-like [Pleurodeles waltl]|uniref:nicotinamide N-methyltransferase-like n=1 Tax=Pleurodeles waltl TaxID=8319 RepID=UPI0037099351